LKFITNWIAVEKVIKEAREATRPAEQALPTPAIAGDEEGMRGALSADDLQALLARAKTGHEPVVGLEGMLTPRSERPPRPKLQVSMKDREESLSFRVCLLRQNLCSSLRARTS